MKQYNHAARVVLESDLDGSPLWTAYDRDGRQLGFGYERLGADDWELRRICSSHGVTVTDETEIVER